MSETSRERLLRLVRRSDADLAEAALLCSAEVSPTLDVDAVLLRVDALADAFATRSEPTAALPEVAARSLVAYLGAELGFTAADPARPEPAGSRLELVLDARHGHLTCLAILHVAIARRVRLPAYLVQTPGRALVAIAGGERPVVFDPADTTGTPLDEATLAQLVTRETAGRVAFRRAMLRPAPAVDVTRRVLGELTHALLEHAQPASAVRTSELRLLLPNRRTDDHRAHGDLLAATGRFDLAAAAYERYLEADDADDELRASVLRAAIEARARLN